MELNNMLENRVESPSQSDVEIKTETNLNPPRNFYFNPVIYFPCKLCRRAFSTVDKLLQHKGQKHTWNELKEIKFILFEERFVQDEFFFNNLLLPQENSIKENKTEKHETKVFNPFLVSSETNDEQSTCQVETHHGSITVANDKETVSRNSEKEANISGKEGENEVSLHSCLNLNVESNSSNSKTKTNPYVRLLKMTEKEIQDARNDLKDMRSRQPSEKTNQEQEKTKSNFQYYSLNSKKFNNEFIILDVIPQPDGQREITFTTSTKVNADQSLLVAEQERASEPEATKEQELKPEPKNLVQDEPAEQVDGEDGVSIPNEGDVEESEFNSEPESELAPASEPTPKPNTESLDSPATIFDVETKAPSKRYIKRSCTKVTKNYIDAEEFQCAKCSFLFFSQSELDEHARLYCKKTLSNKEPKNKTVISLDSESDHEWTENPGENSEAEDQNYDDEHTVQIISARVKKSTIRSSRSISIESDSSNTTPLTTENKNQRRPSKMSLKQWLEMYKNKFPDFHMFFDPDPLQETDQIHSQDQSPGGSETDNLRYALQCKLCYHNFFTESMAKGHVMTCWRNKSAIRNYCFKCDKPFTTKDNFHKHNVTCHPELCENDLGRKVKCPTGSQEIFANKAKLKLHMASRKDPKNNMTGECVSTSSLKQWLKIYKKRHPDGRVYFDPDPLQEPDQCQSHDSNFVQSGTETVLFPIRCKLCNINVYTEVVAKEHASTCWNSNKAIPRYCFICDKFFPRKNCLQKHNFSKHPELGEKDVRPKVKCPTCSKELIGNQAQLRMHMAIHENNPEKKFMCEVCGYCGRTKYDLKVHTERHSEERPYKCPDCSMGFKTLDGLTKHKRKHSTVSYTCTQCPSPKTYRRLENFQDHIRTRHTQEKPFACPHAFGSEKCALMLSTRNQLIAHCRKEHPEAVKRKKYPCTLCSKTFWNNANLKIHMIKHTGVRPFKCTHEGCSRTFSANFDLKEHMRTHTGENPFQCDACGKTFWKHFSWVTHCRVWCPNKSSAEDRNILLCHLCPRKFPIMWELKRHLKLHEEGKVSADGIVRGGAKGKVKGQDKGRRKELECEVCDFKCGTKKDLKEHEKFHDEEDECIEEEHSGDEAEETESSLDLETEEYVALGVEATDACEKELSLECD